LTLADGTSATNYQSMLDLIYTAAEDKSFIHSSQNFARDVTLCTCVWNKSLQPLIEAVSFVLLVIASYDHRSVNLEKLFKISLSVPSCKRRTELLKKPASQPRNFFEMFISC